jgi:hypothetical protein
MSDLEAQVGWLYNVCLLQQEYIDVLQKPNSIDTSSELADLNVRMKELAALKPISLNTTFR